MVYQDHYTHNDFHIGDNLINLHFLRDLALRNPGHRFLHAVHPCHFNELVDSQVDIPNIGLISIEDKHQDSIDLWRNAGDVWNRHQLRNKLGEYHLVAYRDLANQMGLRSRFVERSDWRDLLFDYPELLRITHTQLDDFQFDILFNNSQPCSGQFLPYDNIFYFDELIADLMKKHRVLVTSETKTGAICTRDFGLNITSIGNLSIGIPYIFGIPNGPMWPTFNIWNVDTVKFRLLFLANGEQLNYSPSDRTFQAKSLDEARKALKEKGLL